jgi:hypothetical protein
MMTILRKVLAAFVAACSPFPELLLGFVTADPDVLVAPKDPAAMLAGLIEQFGVEAVVASGVAVEDGGSPLSLSIRPALLAGPFIVCRHWESREPFDLLSEAGSLYSGHLPALHVLQDRRTRRLIERNDKLCIAFSIRDCVVLRSCGLAATVATGLEALSVAQLQQFCQAFELESSVAAASGACGSFPVGHFDLNDDDDDAQDRADDADGDDDDASGIRLQSATCCGEVASLTDPYQPVAAELVVVRWSPEALSGQAPPQATRLLDSWVELERHLGFELIGIGSWDAPAPFLERLTFLAHHQAGGAFRTEIVNGSRELFALDSPNRPKPPAPPANLAQAVAQLHRLTYGSSSEEQQKWLQACRVVEGHIQRQLVDPLFERAMSATDSLSGNLFAAAGAVSAILQRQALLVFKHLNQPFGQYGPDQLSRLSAEDMRNFFALNDRFLEIMEACQKCSRSSQTLTWDDFLNSPTSRRLPASASKQRNLSLSPVRDSSLTNDAANASTKS